MAGGSGRAEDPVEALRLARTALFVPGDRPERFAKAAASDADLVLLDLEDAVAAESKAEALDEVVRALGPSSAGELRAVVRVTPTGSPTHDQEVEALLGLAAGGDSGLLGLMLPKAEDPRVVAQLAARTAERGLGLLLLIESAAGVLAAAQLAAVPGATRLALGAVDYCLDIDADPDLDAVLDHPRTVLALASRAAGLPAALDTPSTSIRELGPVEASARRGRALGMGGKLCIHPAQLAAAAAPFQPTEEEIEWARRVLAVEGGAVQIDGAMVDRPVQDRARRILAAAPEGSEQGTTEATEKDS